MSTTASKNDPCSKILHEFYPDSATCSGGCDCQVDGGGQIVIVNNTCGGDGCSCSCGGQPFLKIYQLVGHLYEGKTFPGSCGLPGDTNGFAIKAYVKLWRMFQFWMRVSIALGVLSLILAIAAIYGFVR